MGEALRILRGRRQGTGRLDLPVRRLVRSAVVPSRAAQNTEIIVQNTTTRNWGGVKCRGQFWYVEILLNLLKYMYTSLLLILGSSHEFENLQTPPRYITIQNNLNFWRSLVLYSVLYSLNKAVVRLPHS